MELPPKSIVISSMRWPRDLWVKIAQLAGAEGRSFHAQVIWMLRKYIARNYGGKP